MKMLKEVLFWLAVWFVISVLFWFVISVLFGVIKITVAYGGLAEEFEFKLLLEQQRQEHSIVLEEGLRVFDYAALAEQKWQGGALVFISSKECEPCEVFKNSVLTDPKVIVALNEYRYTEAPVESWQEWKRRTKYFPPFIVVVNEKGQAFHRFQCSTDVNVFLKSIENVKNLTKEKL